MFICTWCIFFFFYFSRYAKRDRSALILFIEVERKYDWRTQSFKCKKNMSLKKRHLQEEEKRNANARDAASSRRRRRLGVAASSPRPLRFWGCRGRLPTAGLRQRQQTSPAVVVSAGRRETAVGRCRGNGDQPRWRRRRWKGPTRRPVCTSEGWQAPGRRTGREGRRPSKQRPKQKSARV